ncbi:MAG: hypothetical protein DWQ47_04315 [Acidobacteria bacterium]|nr:MAG: hypothetical protein DWQ32_07865 [Acidobacteriota bacterium]REK01616.1 MAG: hypothetical protein DWQ38_04300 [Acidobacteriota bacterium]REK14572.1 MAG: hypothetical protein DWQ43_13555 [Acidobacteriota bacterium]REK45287.1 MAG: hypothetical protein DWQ47_04315 [Acidobacteriota bacterium]
MKLKLILAVTALAVFAAACGTSASGPATLTVKKDGGDSIEVPVRSGGFYASTKTWSRPGKTAKSSSYFICVANYDIDMSQGAISIGAKVSADDQTKICFSLNGEENGTDKSAPVAGTYEMEKRGDDFPFNSISSVFIRSMEDGKEVRHSFSTAKSEGSIKLTSASTDDVAGEIDLSDGQNEVKGIFTAKAFKRS